LSAAAAAAGATLRLRRDVEALAAIERGSATPGERRSAEWVAGRLREQGGEDVRLASFPYQGTFAHAQALHYAAGLLATLTRRRALALAALASFELDYSGRSQWLRRILPASEGTNAMARLPARGERRRTVVLVAHHDAARTGLMWHPSLTAAGDRAAARSGKRASLALVPELALAAAALGLRRLPAAALVLALVLALDQARSPAVPGANDNASGVAAGLELFGRLAGERPDWLEVVALFPGCEESGMGGMAAWLARAGQALDGAATLVLGLDTVGSGQPIVLAAEGGLWPVRYAAEEVALAERHGLRRWRIGGWTDPALARLAGLRAVSILSVRDGGFPHYHLPSDTPEKVDLACVERCIDAAEAIALVD
jgi:hypothetical protein